MDKTLNGLLQPDPKILDQLQHETVVLPSILKLQPEQKEAPDYAALLEAARIRPTDHIEPPAVAWQTLNAKGEFIPLGHCGDFSLIIGKAKSRKTWVITIAVCAAVQNDAALGIIKSEMQGKEVLYFDTEQSDYYVKKAIDRICRSTNQENPKNLQVYTLRKFKPQMRLKMIEHAIYNTPNLGFVIIDGIKDLITSINDEQEATMIASELLKWTTETNCHIVAVLHQNKGDLNARGHVGTELINKAETVLSVTKSDKDKEISIVEPQQTRGIEPDPFAFQIVDGLPSLATDFNIKSEKSTRFTKVEDITNIDKLRLLTEIFNIQSEYTYTELCHQIQRSSGAILGVELGQNKCKDFIKLVKSENLVSQPKVGLKYFLTGLRGLEKIEEPKPLQSQIDVNNL
jgi:hypothetical protein